MFSLDDFADEYHTTVVVPREIARAAIDAEYRAALDAIESVRRAKLATAGIDVDPPRATRKSIRAPRTASRLNGTAILKPTVANYHTPGRKNYAYFAAIEKSRTIADAIAAGVPRHHLRYEIDHGYVVVN